MKKKAFTLIELIAVLVILAILALIVTPLVMNIIRKARIAADKRSIDAYGRSVELAIANYLLDNRDFPTSIEQLTIEYSGDEVVCSIAQLNSDSSVYLSGCTVAGRTVDYAYGTDNTPSYTAYSVGDEVSYNNVDYYVIKDSDVKESNVTLLKSEPLTVEEVNQYGAGHVNRYTYDSVGTAYNLNGYGGIAYYSSVTCGFVNNNWVETGCTTSYVSSDIKYVVDGWKNAQALAATEARLMTLDFLPTLGYELQPKNDTDSSLVYKKTSSTPTWLYDSNYWYWTNSQYNDSSYLIWDLGRYGDLDSHYVYSNRGNPGNYGVVRPVIVINKSALG